MLFLQCQGHQCQNIKMIMGLPAHLQVEIISHARLVRQLYKGFIRNIRDVHIEDFIEYRYMAIRIRAEFDKHKNEPDVRKAKWLLAQGQIKLDDSMYYQPFKHAYSPGGLAFGRENRIPDWILDQWHPLEKAQYPKYFALRDQRKKEFIERWEKEYGKPDPDSAHH